YVANVVQANLKAITAPGVSGEMFNVGCGERYTLNWLIDALAEILGVTPRVERRDPRPGDVPHSLADIRKAQAMLGYRPAAARLGRAAPAGPLEPAAHGPDGRHRALRRHPHGRRRHGRHPPRHRRALDRRHGDVPPRPGG